MDQNSDEVKPPTATKIEKLEKLDFSKIYQTDRTKFTQESSGEEPKNDSRGILQEILVTSDLKNDSAAEESENFAQEFQPQ